MQEVESRKRPHLGDPDPLPSKKRAVSVNCTTVPVNGNVHPTSPVDEEEPRDQDSLEVCPIPLPSSTFYSHFLRVFFFSNSERRPFSVA